jgi:hypothetical protein
MLEPESIKRNPMFWYLVVLTISSTVGLQTWTTLFNNFAVDVAGLQGNHVGMIQSIREIPGFLALLAVYVLLVIPSPLSAISILILGAGLAATGFFPSFAGVAVTTLISSFGFHYYETTNMSLTLQYFKKDESPWVFGKLTSLAAATSIGIGLLIWGMTLFLDFTRIYLVVGVLIASAGLWALLTRDPSDINIIPQRKQMVLRKKYWLFYFLTFMAGARRQIFIAFSVLLLVQKFQYTVQEVTILFIINNTINYFLSPLIGKSIIRFGERKILSLEYFSVIFIFTAYATTDSKLLVAFIYVLDQIFFTFAIAIRTYFQKVGDPRDIAPSMAVGFTINHLAAVFLPAIGGMLWIIDYRIPFFAGAAMGVVSLLAVQKIKTAHS